jgi:hypothetical protein
MAQAPVPEGLSGIPDHGERSAPHGTAKGISARLTEAGRQTYDEEQPSIAAILCVSLLPVPAAGIGWAAVIGAVRPFAGLALMGVIAPAATIYAAKAARYPPTFTAAVVGLEVALAYLASRTVNATGVSPRTDRRSLTA